MAIATLSVTAACGSAHSSLSARIASGREALVPAFADPAQPGSLVPRVDLATATVGTPLHTTVPEAAAVAAVPGTADVVVVGAGNDQLVEVGAASGTVHLRVTVGLRPDAVAVTPNGASALVADGGSGRLTTVDLRSGRVVRTLAVGAVPAAVAVAPAASRAIVVDEGQGTGVLVPLSGAVPGSPVAVGPEPDAVAVAPDGITALVADLGGDELTPVDLATATVQAPVAVGVPPTGIATTAHPAPGTSRTTDPAGTAWVTGGDSLVPVDLATMTAGTALAVGHPAEAVALTANGTLAWVAGTDGTLTELDLATGRVLHTVHVGGRPSAVLVLPGRRGR